APHGGARPPARRVRLHGRHLQSQLRWLPPPARQGSLRGLYRYRPLPPAAHLPLALERSLVAQGPGPRRVRIGLAVCAVLYWMGLISEASDPGRVKLTPRPLRYFMQVASLFPKAAENITEYRAEAWYCAEHTWREIDVRPFFPLRAND